MAFIASTLKLDALWMFDTLRPSLRACPEYSVNSPVDSRSSTTFIQSICLPIPFCSNSIVVILRGIRGLL